MMVLPTDWAGVGLPLDRCFILGRVTDVRGAAVPFYTSCSRCYSKVTPLDAHSIRCYCPKCRLEISGTAAVTMRYRLSLTVSDGHTEADVIVFGRNLDPFIGCSANQLDGCRSCSEMVQLARLCPSAPGERSLVSDLICDVFIGHSFHFGFKVAPSRLRELRRSILAHQSDSQPAIGFRRLFGARNMRRDFGAELRQSNDNIAWQMLLAPEEHRCFMTVIQKIYLVVGCAVKSGSHACRPDRAAFLARSCFPVCSIEPSLSGTYCSRNTGNEREVPSSCSLNDSQPGLVLSCDVDERSSCRLDGISTGLVRDRSLIQLDDCLLSQFSDGVLDRLEEECVLPSLACASYSNSIGIDMHLGSGTVVLESNANEANGILAYGMMADCGGHSTKKLRMERNSEGNKVAAACNVSFDSANINHSDCDKGVSSVLTDRYQQFCPATPSLECIGNSVINGSHLTSATPFACHDVVELGSRGVKRLSGPEVKRGDTDESSSNNFPAQSPAFCQVSDLYVNSTILSGGIFLDESSVSHGHMPHVGSSPNWVSEEGINGLSDQLAVCASDKVVKRFLALNQVKFQDDVANQNLSDSSDRHSKEEMPYSEDLEKFLKGSFSDFTEDASFNPQRSNQGLCNEIVISDEKNAFAYEDNSKANFDALNLAIEAQTFESFSPNSPTETKNTKQAITNACPNRLKAKSAEVCEIIEPYLNSSKIFMSSIPNKTNNYCNNPEYSTHDLVCSAEKSIHRNRNLSHKKLKRRMSRLSCDDLFSDWSQATADSSLSTESGSFPKTEIYRTEAVDEVVPFPHIPSSHADMVNRRESRINGDESTDLFASFQCDSSQRSLSPIDLPVSHSSILNVDVSQTSVSQDNISYLNVSQNSFCQNQSHGSPESSDEAVDNSQDLICRVAKSFSEDSDMFQENSIDEHLSARYSTAIEVSSKAPDVDKNSAVRKTFEILYPITDGVKLKKKMSVIVEGCDWSSECPSSLRPKKSELRPFSFQLVTVQQENLSSCIRDSSESRHFCPPSTIRPRQHMSQRLPKIIDRSISIPRRPSALQQPMTHQQRLSFCEQQDGSLEFCPPSVVRLTKPMRSLISAKSTIADTSSHRVLKEKLPLNHEHLNPDFLLSPGKTRSCAIKADLHVGAVPRQRIVQFHSSDFVHLSPVSAKPNVGEERCTGAIDNGKFVAETSTPINVVFRAPLKSCLRKTPVQICQATSRCVLQIDLDESSASSVNESKFKMTLSCTGSSDIDELDIMSPSFSQTENFEISDFKAKGSVELMCDDLLGAVSGQGIAEGKDEVHVSCLSEESKIPGFKLTHDKLNALTTCEAKSNVLHPGVESNVISSGNENSVTLVRDKFNGLRSDCGSKIFVINNESNEFEIRNKSASPSESNALTGSQDLFGDSFADNDNSSTKSANISVSVCRLPAGKENVSFVSSTPSGLPGGRIRSSFFPALTPLVQPCASSHRNKTFKKDRVLLLESTPSCDSWLKSNAVYGRRSFRSNGSFDNFRGAQNVACHEVAKSFGLSCESVQQSLDCSQDLFEL